MCYWHCYCYAVYSPKCLMFLLNILCTSYKLRLLSHKSYRMLPLRTGPAHANGKASTDHYTCRVGFYTQIDVLNVCLLYSFSPHYYQNSSENTDSARWSPRWSCPGYLTFFSFACSSDTKRQYTEYDTSYTMKTIVQGVTWLVQNSSAIFVGNTTV